MKHDGVKPPDKQRLNNYIALVLKTGKILNEQVDPLTVLTIWAFLLEGLVMEVPILRDDLRLDRKDPIDFTVT